jgi:hypothetical protein
MNFRWHGEGTLPVDKLTVSASSRSIRRGIPLAGGCLVLVLSVLVASPALSDRGSQQQAHAGHSATSAMGHGAREATLRPGQVTPGEVTLRLQALIGQHSALSADMMRGRLRGDPDFAQAANAALTKNTEELGALVGSLFGDAAKKQFTTLWAAHVTMLFNYSRGLAEKNEAVKSEARAALHKYESDLAGFFAAAAAGRLPKAAAESAVQAHVHHLLDQADAYAAGDYARSAQLYRTSYAHSFGLGNAVAKGLLGPNAKALETPAWRLESQLGRMLGEHVALVVTAIRAGLAKSADFPASADTLNGNSRDLAGAVDSLFGAAAAQRFQQLWADHVDAIVSYTAATAARDEQRRSEARAKLDGFQRDFAQYLNKATAGRLGASTLTQAFTMHDQMLLRTVDALAAKQYQQANDIAYEVYQQMFQLAASLSDAIGATIAGRLPKGGAETGGGGMAAVVGRR